MGKMKLALELDAGAAAPANGRGGPFAHAIHGQDRGIREWRRKKCTRRMRHMMLREQQALFCVKVLVELPQRLLQQFLLEQFLLQPDWYSHAERLQAAGRECNVGLEQTLEFDKWL